MKIYFGGYGPATWHQSIWATDETKCPDLNLEAAGVTLNEKGFIVQWMNTRIQLFQESMLLGMSQEKRINPVAKAGRTLSERLFNGKVNAKMDYTKHPDRCLFLTLLSEPLA